MVLNFVRGPHADPVDPFKNETIDQSDKDEEEENGGHDLAVREAIFNAGRTFAA